MRNILKHFIIDTVSLYLISLAVSGIIFEKGFQTLLLAGVALTITTMFVRPILNILLLPINLITFGLFKWVTSAIVLYLVTVIVPGFRLTEFAFNGFHSVWVVLPAIIIPNPLAFLAFTFLISFVSSTVYWIFG